MKYKTNVILSILITICYPQSDDTLKYIGRCGTQVNYTKNQHLSFDMLNNVFTTAKGTEQSIKSAKRDLIISRSLIFTSFIFLIKSGDNNYQYKNESLLSALLLSSIAIFFERSAHNHYTEAVKNTI